MNSEYIHTLLSKYWNCKTSVEEEQLLTDYFSKEEIPVELAPYIPLFAYIEEERSIAPSQDFEDNLQAIGDKRRPRRKYVTIRIFTPILHIAASLLLVIGVGASLFFILRQENKPHFAETYQDPNAAIKDATYALKKISDALQESEKVSFQTLQIIDELKIDWLSLDSINSLKQKTIDTNNMDSGLCAADTIESTKIGKRTRTIQQGEIN